MKQLFFVVSVALILGGCAAIQPINPEVNSKVIASNNPPPRGCKFVKQILGSQGNAFTGGFTSNANLEIGAMNDLKNKAYLAGGNYIQIVTNRAGVTGSSSLFSNGNGGFVGGGNSQETNVTSTGNIYRCPPKSIGLS